MDDLIKDTLLILLGVGFTSLVGIVGYIFKRRVEKSPNRESLEEKNLLLEIHQKMAAQNMVPEQLLQLKKKLLQEDVSHGSTQANLIENPLFDALVTVLGVYAAQIWLGIQATTQLKNISSDSRLASDSYTKTLWDEYNFIKRWLQDINKIDGVAEALKKRIGFDLKNQLEILDIAETQTKLMEDIKNIKNLYSEREMEATKLELETENLWLEVQSYLQENPQSDVEIPQPKLEELLLKAVNLRSQTYKLKSEINSGMEIALSLLEQVQATLQTGKLDREAKRLKDQPYTDDSDYKANIGHT